MLLALSVDLQNQLVQAIIAILVVIPGLITAVTVMILHRNVKQVNGAVQSMATAQIVQAAALSRMISDPTTTTVSPAPIPPGSVS